MRQVWLRNNARIWLCCISLPLLAAVCAIVWLVAVPQNESWSIGKWIASGLLAVSAAVTAVFVRLARTPRLGYENGSLLVFLGTAHPIRVPIDVVEVFFRGEGPTMLGGKEDDESQTATIVVRLAEAADEWKQREVKRSLGHWCDGYITIRGTWCEPITADLLKVMNQRLVEAHREVRVRQGETIS